MSRGYVIDPHRCAYGSGNEAAAVGFQSIVSLYNNDPQGRVFAIHDLGRSSNAGQLAGFIIAKGTVGAFSANCLPVISDDPQPPGQIFLGATVAGAQFLVNGVANQYLAWAHDFPLVVIAAGYSITAYGAAANSAISCGFWYQVVNRAELSPPIVPPRLEIPKVITLTVESE